MIEKTTAAFFRGSSHSICGHISGELKLIMLNVSQQQLQLHSFGVCTNSPLCFPSVALFLDLSLQLSSQLSGRLCSPANTQVTQVLEKLMRCPESPKCNSPTGAHLPDVLVMCLTSLAWFNSLICSGRGHHWVSELRYGREVKHLLEFNQKSHFDDF